MVKDLAKVWKKAKNTEKWMLGLVVALFVLATASLTLAVDIYIDKNIEAVNNGPIENSKVKEAVVSTNFGNITIELTTRNKLTRDNFISLVRQNFYSQLLFHRVVKGFTIQGGDPTTRNPEKMAHWGDGGPGYTIPREINTDDVIERGSVIMVTENDRSNGSQFMIITSDTKWLSGHNAILGKVTAGMEVVDAISNLDTGVTGIPAEKVILLSAELQ